MLSVKLDHKPPVEHPPVNLDLDLTPVNPETVDEVLNQESSTESNEGKVFQEIPECETESPIQDSIRLIITRVEALDKTDERIKAIGKLKGALELLS